MLRLPATGDRTDASAFVMRENNEVLLLEDFVSTASTEQIV
jgi:hypothetical protein